MGKWANGTYQTDGRCTSWVKFKNPEYSQIIPVGELTQRPVKGLTWRALRLGATPAP